MPLDLRHGSTIDSSGARIFFGRNDLTLGVAETRVALLRENISTGVIQSLKSGIGYDLPPNNGSAFTQTVTVDQFLAVDRDTYEYYMWFWGNADSSVELRKIEIDYTSYGLAGRWR